MKKILALMFSIIAAQFLLIGYLVIYPRKVTKWRPIYIFINPSSNDEPIVTEVI